MPKKQNTKSRILQIGDITITPEPRSRYLTLTIGGSSARVHYKELWSALFVLGDGRYREAMLPVRKRERVVFSRKLQIQAKKDLKAGEIITVWAEFNVDKDVVESIMKREGVETIEQAQPLSTGALVEDETAAVG